MDSSEGTALNGLGHVWAALRAASGLTQKEAARRASIPQPYLSQIESGRMVPTDGERAALLRVYGVSAAA